MTNPPPHDERDSRSKYGGLVAMILAELHADAVAVVILGGVRGSGGASIAVSTDHQRRLALEMGKLAGVQDRHAEDIDKRG